MKATYLVPAIAAMTTVAAQAEGVERGIKCCNERVTLKPYVSASYTYDSNVDSGKHGKAGSQWIINPGLGAEYNGDNWAVDAAVWYQYHAYNRYTSQLNQSSYGESLKLKWTNAAPDEKGWNVLISERFQQIAQDDDMSNHNGRGMGRDRKELNGEMAVERRINRYLHADLTGDYYLLDYDNNVDKYATLYGWKRLSLGGQLGYTASQWSDILLAANYQWYWQDNDTDRGEWSRGEASSRGRRVRSDSKGWSVMGGLATHATEKLTYKVLAGWSRFEYGSGTKDIDGWTYQLNGNWQVDAENTLNVSVLGSSYYQPSEREYGSAIKVYNLSAGVRKSLVRNKLHVTADLAYRKETHEYTEYAEDDYDEDIWTARVGVTYDVNRYVSVFGRLEYQTEETEGGGARSHEYDYDRWRGTVGVRLTY